MLGEATTVVLGDYYAGPNHILPTGRRARFASPLTAENFRKVSSVIEFTDARVKQAAPDVLRLARAEELTAHARAIEMRQ
jgi:histidinol dehydrogenase